MARELDGWRDEIELIHQKIPGSIDRGDLRIREVAKYKGVGQRAARDMFIFRGGVISIQDYAKARRRKALGMEPRYINRKKGA